MQNTDWEIPANLQPHPDDYSFDLEGSLRSVVELRATVPADAHTAVALGTERSGSGVMIGPGLVLTIGYLIMEAETIWLVGGDGRAVPGYPAAVDPVTGFGLVQVLGRTDLPIIELGDSTAATPGTTAILAAGGGRQHAIEVKVVGRQEFAGYWEYLLDEALFTGPAHPYWSGAALIGASGQLIGISSLILQQSDGKGRRHDMNMVVPISLLQPILKELTLFGRSSAPPRPWLGLSAVENDGALLVSSVTEGGPAERAGVQAGDRLLGIQDESIADLAGLWRRLWACGPVGVIVRLEISRNGNSQKVHVTTGDRSAMLRGPRLH